MSKGLKTIYAVFIGVLLALFVGVGIDAFYKSPKFPDYPVELNQYPDESGETREEIEKNRSKNNEAQMKYEAEMKIYENKYKEYSRNVSVIALIFSVLILFSSLTFANKIYLISDGLLLGGLFTLIYSLIRGFEADSSIFRFLVVSVSLFLSLVIGYVKFIKPSKNIELQKSN